MASFEQGVALVIGVGNYEGEGFGSLPATVQDATNIARVLKDAARCAYPEERVTVITGNMASRKRILDALDRVAEQASPDSTVVIFFSGHGGQIQTEAGTETYLCPRGADINELDHTAISRDRFSEALKKIPSRKMLVILDCCYAAAAAELKSGGVNSPAWKGGLNDSELKALESGSGRVILASSERSQPSYIDGSGQQSLFTRHLVAALEGALPAPESGLIGVLDLFNYVAGKVPQDKPGQRPILHTGHLDSNFPVALYRGGQKGPGAASDSAPATAPTTSSNNVQNINSTVGNQVVGNGTITVNNQGISPELLLELWKKRGDSS